MEDVMRVRVIRHGEDMTSQKAELTPGLARDRAATWRLIMNFDSSAAIECLTCAATWRKR